MLSSSRAEGRALQAPAALSGAKPIPELANRKPDYSKLSRAEVASIFSLHKAGKTQAEIAKALSTSVSTVCRWLQTLEDTTDLAKQRLKNGAEALSERILKDATVEESLEVLDRLEVLPKKEKAANASGGVQVVVLMPGQEQVKPPVLDLSPSTFALNPAQTVAVSD